jgi:UDP-glucose 4-epimerase
MQSILVTGGNGFIGSHTVVELLALGNEVVVYDSLVNSSRFVLERILSIVGGPSHKAVALKFVEGDIRDKAKLTELFKSHSFDCVIHFAGLKSVTESYKQPLEYYSNNVVGTMSLCEAMRAASVKKLVFSSSATVYGEGSPLPYEESIPLGAIASPYGYSKAMIEKMLADLCNADASWSVAVLRYFNPIGAHKSGLIGEDPRGTPNNLVPYICQVAAGVIDELSVFGDDYDTLDGTGVRDYIHVLDVASGHLKAIEKLNSKELETGLGMHIWNLGTGQGASVLQVIRAFETASGTKIPYSIKDRRPGDIGSCWASAAKSLRDLDWVAKHNLEEMAEDAWRWQQANPLGYDQ